MTVATSRIRMARAVAVGNDDRPILSAGLELIVIVDGPRLIRPVEIAFGLVHIGTGQGRSQSLHAQAVRCERCGICLDTDGGTLSSADAHETDALELQGILCAIRVSASSSTFGNGTVVDVRASVRIGASAGFVLL